MKRLLLTGILFSGAAIVASFSIGRATADREALPPDADDVGRVQASSIPATPFEHHAVPGSSTESSRSSVSAAFDPTSVRVRMEDKVVELDDRLRMEPLSPQWAARSTLEIRQAISTEELKDFGAPAPKSVDISCRSTACRISMSFDDPLAAPETVTALTVGIAAAFPQVVVVPIPGENGVQYHVFAAANRGSQLFRTNNSVGRTPDSCTGKACSNG